MARLFAEATAALGPLGGLVNNAGSTGQRAPIEEQQGAELVKLFSLNVVGVILASKEAVLRLSKKHGGSGGAIINISSVAARLGGMPGLLPYAASKGAISTFTRGLAGEVGRDGIRVNAVAPGFVETDMTSAALSNPAFRERIEALAPLGRVGVPDEIAEAVAWLASPASRFVTGEVMAVSGGA